MPPSCRGCGHALWRVAASLLAVVLVGKILGAYLWWPVGVEMRMGAAGTDMGRIKFVRRASDGVVEFWGRGRAHDPDFFDFARGLGYIHAMDRGLHLSMTRILAAGKLCSPSFGYLVCDDKMRAVDQWMAHLHFPRLAREHTAALKREDPRTFAFVEAYAEGVNARWRQHGLPWEMMALLRFPAEEEWEWTVEDTMLLTQFFSYVGMAQTQEDVERFMIEAVQMGDRATEFVHQLFFPHSNILSAERGGDAELLAALRALELPANEFHTPTFLHALPVAFKASNSWAVGGNFTRAGSGAILATDPHAQVNRLPSLLHEVIYHRGDSDNYIVGVSLPGQPTLGIGRTPHVGWGVTYGYADSVELHVEKCRFNAKADRNECARTLLREPAAHDGAESADDYEWMPVVSEQVSVSMGLGHDNFVRYVHTIPDANGAILDATTVERELSSLAEPSKFPHYLSRTILTDTRSPTVWRDLLITGMLENDAADNQTIVEAMADTARGLSMAVNFVIADRDGNIGLQQAGLMPQHEGLETGMIPALRYRRKIPVSEARPREELTRVLNPKEGYVAITNENAYGQEGINLHMGPYRRERITEKLEEAMAQGPADPAAPTCESMRELQLDVFSRQAEQFMKQVFLPALEGASASLEGPALEALRAWNFTYGKDEIAPDVFERIYQRGLRAMVDFGLDPSDCKSCKHGSDDHHITDAAFNLLSVGLIPGVYHHYFDRLLLDWPAEVDGVAWPAGTTQKAFWLGHVQAVLSELNVNGGRLAKWGEVHCSSWNNLLLDGHLGPVGEWIGIDGGCVPMMGSRATITQAQKFDLGDIGQVASGPIWRMVSDMSDASTTMSVIPGGPTDRWLSPFYLSEADAWSSGRYKNLSPA